MATREEHLAWCRTRALEYLEMDQLDNAFVSFVSDLGKMDIDVDEQDLDGSPENWLSLPSRFAGDGFKAVVAKDKAALRQLIEDFQ